MAFIFTTATRDVVRNRTLDQSVRDRIEAKARGANAPAELPDSVTQGITPNGTYFFCNIIFQKDRTDRARRDRMSILSLIDAYAETQDPAEQVRLKNEIKAACGTQTEGIALLFLNSRGAYGFVTGSRVRVAAWGGLGPLDLDDNELFSVDHNGVPLHYYSFVLTDETDRVSQAVADYVSGDEIDDAIDTGVINAIKPMMNRPASLEQMSRYLENAYAKIQNPILREPTKAVYDALRLLTSNEEMKFKATVLTLQLLHSGNDDKRKQLLRECTELASTLYGSKVPSLMLVGVGLFLLSASLLLVSILIIPVIPLYIVTGFGVLTGLVSAIEGGREFYAKEPKQQRNTANTFFSLIKTVNHLPDNQDELLIPRKIINSAG